MQPRRRLFEHDILGHGYEQAMAWSIHARTTTFHHGRDELSYDASLLLLIPERLHGVVRPTLCS